MPTGWNPAFSAEWISQQHDHTFRHWCVSPNMLCPWLHNCRFNRISQTCIIKTIHAICVVLIFLLPQSWCTEIPPVLVSSPHRRFQPTPDESSDCYMHLLLHIQFQSVLFLHLFPLFCNLLDCFFCVFQIHLFTLHIV